MLMGEHIGEIRTRVTVRRTESTTPVNLTMKEGALNAPSRARKFCESFIGYCSSQLGTLNWSGFSLRTLRSHSSG